MLPPDYHERACRLFRTIARRIEEKKREQEISTNTGIGNEEPIGTMDVMGTDTTTTTRPRCGRVPTSVNTEATRERII